MFCYRVTVELKTGGPSVRCADVIETEPLIQLARIRQLKFLVTYFDCLRRSLKELMPCTPSLVAKVSPVAKAEKNWICNEYRLIFPNHIEELVAGDRKAGLRRPTVACSAVD